MREIKIPTVKKLSRMLPVDLMQCLTGLTHTHSAEAPFGQTLMEYWRMRMTLASPAWLPDIEELSTDCPDYVAAAQQILTQKGPVPSFELNYYGADRPSIEAALNNDTGAQLWNIAGSPTLEAAAKAVEMNDFFSACQLLDMTREASHTLASDPNDINRGLIFQRSLNAAQKAVNAKIWYPAAELFNIANQTTDRNPQRQNIAHQKNMDAVQQAAELHDMDAAIALLTNACEYGPGIFRLRDNVSLKCLQVGQQAINEDDLEAADQLFDIARRAASLEGTVLRKQAMKSRRANRRMLSQMLKTRTPAVLTQELQALLEVQGGSGLSGASANGAPVIGP